MINFGVIVGRFQVNNLHAGHLELFRQVSEKHERVIVFIGVARTIATARNPLDFETRKKMIQAEYPDFVILPLRDEKNDEVWSKKLDEHIADVTQFTGNVTLYGGRDSFVPHYHGAHKVEQLSVVTSPEAFDALHRPQVTGTSVRHKLANKVISSPDFRAGAIYAASNRFPLCLPTVDVAILHNTGSGYNVLVARKPGESLFRFVGGFAERGEGFERSAKREAYEETGLDLHNIEYIGSFPIQDWRYAQDTDAGIVTTFYAGWSITSGSKAGDDIEATYWIPSQNFIDMPPQDFEPAHRELVEALKKFLVRRGYATLQPATAN